MAEWKDYYIGSKVSGGWKVGSYMTSGSFGTVFEAKRWDGQRGVVKIENPGSNSIEHEERVLKRLQHLSGFPKLYSSGRILGNRMILIQRLGKSLNELMKSHQFRTTDILKLGIQLTERFRDMHGQGILHRDVHASNILTGDPKARKCGKIYLIDFGETISVNGGTPKRVHGNLLFAPNAALLVDKYGRKDDIESMIYVLVYVYSHTLPWKKYLSSHVPEEEYIARCLSLRQSMSTSDICHDLPGSITSILRDVKRMGRHDIPDYEGWIEEMKGSLRNRGASENQRFTWE